MTTTTTTNTSKTAKNTTESTTTTTTTERSSPTLQRSRAPLKITPFVPPQQGQPSPPVQGLPHGVSSSQPIFTLSSPLRTSQHSPFPPHGSPPQGSPRSLSGSPGSQLFSGVPPPIKPQGSFDLETDSERLPSLKQLLGELTLADPLSHPGQRNSLPPPPVFPYRPRLSLPSNSPARTLSPRSSSRSASPRSVISLPGSSNSSPTNTRASPRGKSPNTSPRAPGYHSMFVPPSMARSENMEVYSHPLGYPRPSDQPVSPSPRPSQHPAPYRGSSPSHIQTRSHTEFSQNAPFQETPSLFSQHMSNNYIFSTAEG